MAVLHFNLDDKKYTLEFLEGNRAKIIRLEDKDNFIIAQFLADAKVTDLIKYIRDNIIPYKGALL